MRRHTLSALRVAIYTPQQSAQDAIRKSLDAKVKAQLEGRQVSPGPQTLCSPVGSCEPADTNTTASLIESALGSAGILCLLLHSATASGLFPSLHVMQATQKVRFQSPPYFAGVRRRKHHAIEWFFATTLGRNLNTTLWGTASPGTWRLPLFFTIG